jgi:hypothetical protein
MDIKRRRWRFGGSGPKSRRHSYLDCQGGVV